MDLEKFVRPKIEGKYCTIDYLAMLLKSSPEDLLDAACDGRLQVFVQKPDAFRVCSVHADALDLENEQIYMERVLRRLPPIDPDESKPIEIPPLDPEESQPVDMSASMIEGLRLTRFDCQQIREKQRITQHLFPSGLKVRFAWVDDIQPIRGHFRFSGRETLRSDGWSLACYGLKQPIQFLEGVGYSRPQGVELSLDKLMVTTDDVDRYVDTLNPSYLVSEFIVDDRIATDRLPSYVSRKLIYLIETNEMYWGSGIPTDINEVIATRERARRHLMKPEFQALFEYTKGKLATGQSLFCTECVTPVSLRKAKEEEKWRDEWPGHLTPELLLMLYASMRTWGRPHVRLDDSSSYPNTDEMVELFRELGFTGDEAKSAPTIIRPEGTKMGKPAPPKGPLRGSGAGARAKRKKKA